MHCYSADCGADAIMKSSQHFGIYSPLLLFSLNHVDHVLSFRLAGSL